METSKASGQSTTAPRGLQDVMRQHPLISYFVMAYGFSWIISIPMVLAEWGRLPHPLFALLFSIKPFVGPLLAAYIMTRVTEGKEGWRRLLHRIVQWRESWMWYAFSLLVIPAFFLLGIAVLPGALASFKGITARFPIEYLINFVLILILGGPLGEEPGWRGFALPRLQAHYSAERYGALKASLLLGVLWTFWHLPDFLTSAQHGGPAAGLRPFYANLPIFLAMVMALTFIFTWVYNHAHGSVFMAIVLHTSINTLSIAVPLFPVPAVLDSELGMLIGWGALAVVILVLTRGRLGYKRT